MVGDLDLNKSDMALSRMVWAISMIGAISCEPKSDSSVFPRSMIQAVKKDLEDLDEQDMFDLYMCGVASITGMSDPARKYPPYCKASMCTPKKLLWLKTLYDHLEKCYRNEMYRIPQEPPPGVRKIPPVIVLNHLLNIMKQIDGRKIRVCVNGSKQIQGIEYQESFASALLGLTINLFIAIACWLGMDVYHLDISNCFQCTPDESDEHLWMGPIFPECHSNAKRVPSRSIQDLL